MAPSTRSRSRHDRRGGDPDERVRRAREAQEAAYAASRQVLDQAVQRRDAAWRSAAEGNRRRSLLLLGVPFAPAVVLLVLGILVPALAIVGGLLLITWVALVIVARRETASIPLAGLLEPAEAARAGVLSSLDAVRLEDVTEGLCSALGLPVPALRVLDDERPNAASFGRQPAHASIVVTAGLVRALDRIALEAAVGHELAHIKRADTSSAGLAASAAGRFADAVTGGRAGRWLTGEDREVRADLAAVTVTRYPPGLVEVLESGIQAGAAPPAGLDSRERQRTSRAWLMGPDPKALAERLDVLHEL